MHKPFIPAGLKQEILAVRAAVNVGIGRPEIVFETVEGVVGMEVARLPPGGLIWGII